MESTDNNILQKCEALKNNIVFDHENNVDRMLHVLNELLEQDNYGYEEECYACVESKSKCKNCIFSHTRTYNDGGKLYLLSCGDLISMLGIKFNDTIGMKMVVRWLIKHLEKKYGIEHLKENSDVCI